MADTADAQQYLNKQREAGQDGKNPPQPTVAARLVAQHGENIANIKALIAGFGETQPLLRDLMNQGLDEITDFSLPARKAYFEEQGRRLMEVQHDYELSFTKILIDHPVMRDAGANGIRGITAGTCEALCEAVTQDQNVTNPAECRAIAFKRLDPFNAEDQRGACWLLQSEGACSPNSFATELLTRNIQSETQCTAPAPGLDSTHLYAL